MKTTAAIKPWYQHPLVWMLISIPVSAVAICSVIIWLAFTTEDGLVVDDYYDQGMAINLVLERDQQAVANKLSAELEVQAARRLVRLDFNKGLLTAYPETLRFNLRHATRGDSDLELVLLHGQGGLYISHLPYSLPPGIWYIELGNQDWRLTARSRLENVSAIIMDSADSARVGARVKQD